MRIPGSLLEAPARGIGLLGGTFDPVHIGHMILAEQALRSLSLERIEFLPAGNPWQKHPSTPAADRVHMLELALAGKPHFSINLCEVTRPGLTYTIDTLRRMRRENGPTTPLILILGADQWENLPTWKDWQLFLNYADIAVSTRDGKPPKSCSEVASWVAGRTKSAKNLNSAPCGFVSFFSIPPTSASSSKIRTILKGPLLQDTESTLDTWLCPDVKTYIRAHHLYTEQEQLNNG
ncbi:MAG TPA: nicotinate (nicotinamide) nucleotide adenylyltransferase [Sutterella sp.]|nr:nicotinate (nicotinamide) nucleotide adenylyltransferase [Sutterella sp.]